VARGEDRLSATAPTYGESLLRLFMADALPPEDQIALVHRMRDRARAAQHWMQTDVLPTARALEKAGSRHPHSVARLGADTYGFIADWLDGLASELRREGRQRRSR
jgi:hypothetical protein